MAQRSRRGAVKATLLHVGNVHGRTAMDDIYRAVRFSSGCAVSLEHATGVPDARWEHFQIDHLATMARSG